MATRGITWQGIFGRFVAAVVLVFATYNPEGYSYYHWGIKHLPQVDPLRVFAGVVLLVGWTVFIRATLRSLGPFGLFLAVAFFGTLLWLIVDLGVVPAHTVRAVTYLVLVALCGVLATGMSWSHIRRRLSGQLDVDDVDDDD